MATLLRPEERVLPTLNQDGSRRWIRPRLFKGRFYKARVIVAWALMVLFVGAPFVRMNGKPLILLDVPARQFTLFGRTFLPTDGVLLMFFLLAVFVAVIWLTALFGRVWCGWGCPQTVYMEFLFRPIERLIEGDYLKQRKLDRKKGMSTRRALKYGVFSILAVVLGNAFLAYFVGVDRLRQWMSSSPADHPGGFATMAVTAGLVFFDFAYFREQMCTVVCPYARLQSVLLDTKSLIVAYDTKRGEPRGKKGKVTGDCVDCKACVVACPTGIDIRNGLQLECVGCTQCIDACDGVMTKLKRPTGLIRYSSQDALEKGRVDKGGLLRVRTVVYPVILIGLVAGLALASGSREVADLAILRGIGAPFVREGDTVRNHIRVKIRNRTDRKEAFRLELLDAPGAELIAPENPVLISPGEQVTTSAFVVAPVGFYSGGVRAVRFSVSTEDGFATKVPYKLLGPTEKR